MPSLPALKATKATMQAIVINDMMRPYSMAVAPWSSFRKRLRLTGWHAPARTLRVRGFLSLNGAPES